MLEQLLANGTFYYSTGYDLTNTLQRQCSVDRDSALCKQADDRFFWNRYLTRQFADSVGGDPKFDEFILPLIHGYVEISDMAINGKPFQYALISRQGCTRAGTRFNSRGIDAKGNVSNFAETEQIVTTAGRLFSFVQVRGSIPIYWTQTANVYYKPKLQIQQDQRAAESLKRHFEDLTQRYGKIVIFNLIDTKGYELLMGEAFRKGISALADPQILYKHWDFHTECKKMQYNRVSALLDEHERQLQEQGYFMCDSSRQTLRQQTGVVRTNCMDCLDRTNVVQSMIARRILTEQLRAADILSSRERVEDALELEQFFKNVWADNADAISMQYSGTGALKTDFTRTGKRTAMGAIKDGMNSAIRYVRNNFMDGSRQDALDLFLGNYVIQDSISPFLKERSWRYQVYPPVLVFSGLMFLLSLLVTFDNSFWRNVNYLLWGSLFVMSLRVIFQYGLEFVDSPQFIQSSVSSLNEHMFPDFASRKEVYTSSNPYNVSVGMAEVEKSDLRQFTSNKPMGKAH